MVMRKLISTYKRIDLDPCLKQYTKLNTKWIKDLNVKPATVKSLGENLEEKLHDIGLGSDIMI